MGGHFSQLSNHLKASLTVVFLAVAALCLPTPAEAADDMFSEVASAKVVQISELAKAFAAAPSSRQRVIVTYRFERPATTESTTAVDADAQLRTANADAQAAVLRLLAGEPATGLGRASAQALDAEGMEFSPNIVLSLTEAEIETLAASPDILYIQPDLAYPPNLDTSTAQIGMPATWAAGGTGTGRTIAVLDTGVKRSHEFITSARVVSEACYNSIISANGSTSRCPGGIETVEGVAGAADDCLETDAVGCSHGTHVAGIMMGSNSDLDAGEPAFGVARGANLIAINVFSMFPSSFSSCASSGRPCILSYTSDQLDGLNRVYGLRNTYSIDAINMSLGGGSNSVACDSDARKSIIESLREAGIATVIAAGNNGLNSSVSAPGCISSAITVASNDNDTDTRSSFSNWGSLIDVVAPGGGIKSSVAGSSSTDIASYDTFSGTSMAAPHVAGAFAAIRSCVPTATVTEIEAALETTGTGITSSSVTKPRIAVALAAQSLGCRMVTTTALAVTGASSNFGDEVTLTATVNTSVGGPITVDSVEFRDGIEPTWELLSTQTPVNGIATFKTSSLSAGTHSITAVYLQSSKWKSSRSTVKTVTIVAPSTSTAVTVSKASSVFGEAVGLSATVTSTSGAVNDGRVTFKFGTSVVATAQVSDGTATATAAVPKVGTANITAVYSNSANFGVSTSAPVSHTVNKANTTLSLAASPLTVVYGSSTRLTATVRSVAPGSGTPSGQVVFRQNGAVLGSPVALNNAGVASVQVKATTDGAVKFTATYTGSANHNPSALDDVTVSVIFALDDPDKVSQSGDTSTNSYIATLKNGAVIVWERRGSASKNAILARRVDRAAEFKGAEFVVAPAATGVGAPRVVGLSDGGFVVVWHAGPSASRDIFMRRYDANGAPRGAAVKVNTVASGSQSEPDITVNSDKSFIVTWTSGGIDGSGTGIAARYYLGSGVAASAGQIVVNTTRSGDQSGAMIAPLSTGGHVVSWRDKRSGGYRVLAQRLSATGGRVGSELVVEDSPTSVGAPSIAVQGLQGGAFVVTYDRTQTKSVSAPRDVLMRLYSKGGTPTASSRRVNTDPAGSQFNPGVVALGANGFAISWTADETAADHIESRIFSNTGQPLSGEARINASGAGKSGFSELAVAGEEVSLGRTYLATWSGADGTGDTAIYVRRFISP